MSVESRKTVWWLVLASCGGMACLALLFAIFDVHLVYRRPQRNTGSFLAIVFLVVELTGVAIAVLELQKLYHEQPINWIGRCQISLSDLLSIVFFFAIVMTIYRTLRPDQILFEGLPVSVVLGMGYAISLLCAARTGIGFKASIRWGLAILYLIRALAMTLLGVAVQGFFVGFH